MAGLGDDDARGCVQPIGMTSSPEPTGTVGSCCCGSTCCWSCGCACSWGCDCGCVEVGCAMKSRTVFDGMAKPMPTLPGSPPLDPPGLAIWELTPTTSPWSSSSATPE